MARSKRLETRHGRVYGTYRREIARLDGSETRILHPGDVIILPD